MYIHQIFIISGRERCKAGTFADEIDTWAEGQGYDSLLLNGGLFFITLSKLLS